MREGGKTAEKDPSAIEYSWYPPSPPPAPPRAPQLLPRLQPDRFHSPPPTRDVKAQLFMIIDFCVPVSKFFSKTVHPTCMVLEKKLNNDLNKWL